MKTPREIAAAEVGWAEGEQLPRIYRFNRDTRMVRAGMIEALKWVQTTGYARSMADELLIEAKLAELEKS